MRLIFSSSSVLPFAGVALGMWSALAPAPAQAQTCATPTLAQCKDVAYYSTTCGKPQASSTSKCATLLQADYNATYGSLPKAQRALSGKYQSVLTTIESVSPSTLQVTGPAQVTTYTDWLTKMKTSEVKGLPFVPPWASNGAPVTSCEEYAFDAAYEFSVFDQAVAKFGDDYRAIYNYAVGSQGIANKTLKDRNAETIDLPVWPADTRNFLPKNAFFTAYNYYALDTRPYADIGLPNYKPQTSFGGGFDINELAAGKGLWVRQDWSWHDQMNSAVASVADDVLYRYDAKKEAFLDLMRQREAAYQAALGETGSPRPSAAKMQDLDAQIFAALREAKTIGCLATSTINGCDWSPRLFAKMLLDDGAKRREADFQLCMTYTGNNFSIATATDKSTPKRFRTFLAALVTQATNLNFLKDPVTGKATLRNTIADSGSFGNSDIQALWSYIALWNVTGFEGTKALCDAGIGVLGMFNVRAKVYSSTEQEVFYALVNGATTLDGGSASARIRVLGQEVYNVSKPIVLNAEFKLVDHQRNSFSYQVRGPAVVVLGLTLGINPGVSASVALDDSLTIFGGLGCSTAAPNQVTIASVTGNVTPSITASVFADIAFGIPAIAEVGVRSTLVLINAALPINAAAKLKLTRSGSTLAVLLDLGMDAKVKLRTLDGELAAFVDTFFGRHEKTFFQWNGLTTEATLYSVAKNNIPLAVVKANL